MKFTRSTSCSGVSRSGPVSLRAVPARGGVAAPGFPSCCPRGRLVLPPQDSPVAAAAGERVLIVAVDAARRLYFENQIIAREGLEGP